ncbi:MAG: histidinol-phosphate aminotransferase family protein [Ferruginibacter sp.]|nr:histidinol-phosphate aminotransferase family protein [Ferruginibacter sp.]
MEKLQRRDWLKQNALLLAGLGFTGKLRSLGLESPGLGDKKNMPPFVKLSANENPYGPSPLAQKAMAAAIAGSNRYAWQLTDEIRKKIGQLYGLDENHVLMGAGSSEILGTVAAFTGKNRGNAVSPHPTFRLWWQVAESFGLTIKKVPLTADKKIETATLLAAMDNNTKLLYICNPNNPTGSVIPAEELKKCIERASEKAMVLLDEAYTEYSDEPSMAPMVATNKNLVVAKTFSKIHGMAGTRTGFALAHPDTIRQLAAFQPWANAGVSAVSLAGALASLDDSSFLKECRAKNDIVKKYSALALEDMKMTVVPSHANFLYYQATGFTGDFSKSINSSAINAVRVFEDTGQWYRTSIGTMEEMKYFIDTVKAKWA